MNPAFLLIVSGGALLVSGLSLLTEKPKETKVLTKSPKLDKVVSSNANSVPSQEEKQDESKTSDNLDSDWIGDGDAV